MSPRRHTLPLLLLLLLLFSLSILFFSYHKNSDLSLQRNSSLNFQHPSSGSGIPKFTFTIKLLAYNRFASIYRCLNSLSNAHYHNDTVHLHVYIDHFPIPDADPDSKLSNFEKILNLVDEFKWGHGQKLVHYRTVNVGLQGQWLEAWWPNSDDDFVFVVEDDLEVSVYYYVFLKNVILNYYFNKENFSPLVYGASLQRPRFVPGKHGSKMRLENEKQLFLYQLVGTWGQLLFPKPWKEFRLWYDTHKTKDVKPFLQGMVTTGWYKKMGERIWTPWFIKFVHSHGYFNIYTNFQHERALSISHRDAGVNYGRNVGPDSDLINESSLDFDLLEMQPLKGLKWYDYCFREVSPGGIIRSSSELRSRLLSLPKQQTVILISILGVPVPVVRNLICHFERLNIKNYLFLGSNYHFLLDLAKRGIPVIDVDQFLLSTGASKLIELKSSSKEMIKEMLVKVYVIKNCLDAGYSSWLVDGNMLLNSTDIYPDFTDPSCDFVAGKNIEFFFTRSSSSAHKIWVDKFMDEAAGLMVSLMSKSSSSSDDKNFVALMVELLERKGTRVKRIDEASIGFRVDRGSSSQTSQSGRGKMLFWSSDMTGDLIQKRLEELGMWIIDGDLSCTAVVCHQS